MDTRDGYDTFRSGSDHSSPAYSFLGGSSIMIYDMIIIGAGAAGLFAGASLPSPVNGLILEKKATPGRKLLLTGSGQCNLTHGGSIKDFIPHYGKNGSQIRSVLYRFNNRSVMEFFEHRGILLTEREDGKVFPKSGKAQEILKVLVDGCTKNGFRFRYSSAADRITYHNGPDSPAVFTVHCGDFSCETEKLIIATGGCSYPATGSDGSFFSVLKSMGLKLVPTAPALVPVYVHEYPYHSLSGISFQTAEAAIGSLRNRDALLLTHTCFSGPAVLNLSRFARSGDTIAFNYYPSKPEEILFSELRQAVTGCSRQILTVFYDYFRRNDENSVSEIPKRFLELLCTRAGIDAAQKASGVPHSRIKEAVRLVVRDEFKIKKLGAYEAAMVTAGGVALSEISMKTMESKKYPGLFFAGETLDVDGDTGGYNLQFAFSSGFLAAHHATGVNF